VQSSPVQQAEALARDARDLATILRATESGELMYSKDDVDRIVEHRLTRERKKRRAVQAELAAVEQERDELEAWLERLQGEPGTPAA
jgi:hypothetical protein